MADNNKVTLRFESYDDDNDNELLYQGPVEVWKTVDNVSDLFLLDLREKDQDDNWVVYVRNVNDPSVPIGSHQYRGAYFKYIPSTETWQEILLGTHSHENKELLDQIGNIDNDNLPYGQQKILVIEKNTDDNIKSDFKISWKDAPKGLPALPSQPTEEHKYLTVDPEGNLSWSNTFIPAESFITKKITVEKRSKEILLTDILYRPSDEIFIFVDKSFLTSYKLDYSGNNLKIILTEEDDWFELGEQVNVLIIKTGIQGVIDEIELHLKQELIEQFSGGTITLKDYLTKDEADERYASHQHGHSQYAAKEHNHDWRYANFQHTHSQYVTKEMVYGIIAGAVDPSGGVNFEDAIHKIEIAITQQLSDFMQQIYNKDQINHLLEEINQNSTTDDITVTTTNTNLTDYLEQLKQSIKDSENIDSNDILLGSGKINLGEGVEFGGFSDGDTIPPTLKEFISKLTTKRVPPVLIKPELTIDIEQSSSDIGDLAFLKITPHFIQNDAGPISEMKIIRSDNIIEIKTFENNMTYETDKFIVGNDLTFTIEISYENGIEKFDNLGLGNYFIHADKFSEVVTPKSERYILFGTSSQSFKDIKDIRDNNAMFKLPESRFRKLAEKPLRFNYENQIKTIIFAFPIIDEKSIDMWDIFYNNQGIDVTDLFIKCRRHIPGPGHDEGIDYKVYHYEFMKYPQHDIKMELELR